MYVIRSTSLSRSRESGVGPTEMSPDHSGGPRARRNPRAVSAGCLSLDESLPIRRFWHMDRVYYPSSIPAILSGPTNVHYSPPLPPLPLPPPPSLPPLPFPIACAGVCWLSLPLRLSLSCRTLFTFQGLGQNGSRGQPTTLQRRCIFWLMTNLHSKLKSGVKLAETFLCQLLVLGRMRARNRAVKASEWRECTCGVPRWTGRKKFSARVGQLACARHDTREFCPIVPVAKSVNPT